MNFGVVLLAVGGFLLGGAWSVWRGGEERGRSAPRVLVALILLLSALLATASGILRLI